MIREQRLAVGQASRLVGLVQPGAPPDLLGALDNKGRSCAVEGEGVEELVGAEPDETRISLDQARLEYLGVLRADLAVDAVGGDQQVGARLLRKVVNLDLEAQHDAKLDATALEDAQQAPPRQAREDVAAAANALALNMHIDRVPENKTLGD